MTWEWIALFILLGSTLLFLELLTPGGILGALGALCLLASIGVGIYFFGSLVGTLLFFGEILGLTLAMRFAARFFPKTQAGKKLILNEKAGEAKIQIDATTKPLLKKTGKIIAPCRPTGIMEAEGKRYHVISEGPFLPSGVQVQVIAVEGTKIVVRTSNKSTN